jgi:hypothetical protein
MSQPDEDDVPAEAVREAADILSIRDTVLEILLKKIEEDRFPSPTMLDDVERLLTPQRRQHYAEVLLTKIREDRFPSRAMI